MKLLDLFMTPIMLSPIGLTLLIVGGLLLLIAAASFRLVTQTKKVCYRTFRWLLYYLGRWDSLLSTNT